jgi:hypothetical protein
VRRAILDLFVGTRRHTAAREFALERIAWLAKHAIPGSVGEGETRAILIAAAAQDGERPEVGAAAELLFGDRSPEERARITLAIGDLASASIVAREFDAVIVTPRVLLDASQRSLQRAWARLRPETGRLVISAEFAGDMTPSALVRVLRTLVQPIELFASRGFIHFVGMKKAPSFEAWQAVASKDRLLEIAEAAVLELDAAWEEDVEALVDSAEESLRSTLVENDRLKEAIERRKGSRRQQLASAFITAAGPPSKAMLQLPGRLLEIYRARRSMRADTGERDEPEGEDAPSDEPLP